jgi:hypothetical protein
MLARLGRLGFGSHPYGSFLVECVISLPLYRARSAPMVRENGRVPGVVSEHWVEIHRVICAEHGLQRSSDREPDRLLLLIVLDLAINRNFTIPRSPGS